MYWFNVIDDVGDMYRDCGCMVSILCNLLVTYFIRLFIMMIRVLEVWGGFL